MTIKPYFDDDDDDLKRIIQSDDDDDGVDGIQRHDMDEDQDILYNDDSGEEIIMLDKRQH